MSHVCLPEISVASQKIENIGVEPERESSDVGQTIQIWQGLVSGVNDNSPDSKHWGISSHQFYLIKVPSRERSHSQPMVEPSGQVPLGRKS